MKFCRPDLCPSCPLAEDKPACLRQKAEFCSWLAARISSPDLRNAVEKMRLELLAEADSLVKVAAQIPKTIMRSRRHSIDPIGPIGPADAIPQAVGSTDRAPGGA